MSGPRKKGASNHGTLTEAPPRAIEHATMAYAPCGARLEVLLLQLTLGGFP